MQTVAIQMLKVRRARRARRPSVRVPVRMRAIHAARMRRSVTALRSLRPPQTGSSRFRPAEIARRAGAILQRIRDLFLERLKLVRVLPFTRSRMRHRDFRTICDCQRHAANRRRWQRPFGVALTVSERLRRGGAVVLIGVPLAFGAIGIPGEAMNAGFPRFESAMEHELPIVTPTTRREFLTPRRARREFTVEIAKEQFFRTSVPYGSIIYREAIKNELAPELVAAVVEAESDFRVSLVSGKDARGLMQIVPETGRLLGAGDLFNPDQNISAGTKYLRYLIDRFRDPRVALAAYNAGEGNVEKWGGIPPFPETMRYLARVNEHARDYRYRIRETYAQGLVAEAAAAR